MGATEDKTASLGSGPLGLDGWVEFNRRKWGVTPLTIHHARSGSRWPELRAVLYLNERSQVVVPPLHPYVALSFHATPTRQTSRASAQWLELAGLFLQDVNSRRLGTPLPLPPDVTDLRPFQWSGYAVGLRYTCLLEFPYSLDLAEGSVRTAIQKARRLDYRCERTTNMRAVASCLEATEHRQGFTHQLTVDDLNLLQTLLGEEHLRAYICYGADGTAAAAQLILHQPGARAIGWVAGAHPARLQDGVNQLLEHETVHDLQAAGASGYDLAGANLPSVAAAKLKWGGQLVAYGTVEEAGLAAGLRKAKRWWQGRGSFWVWGVCYACADGVLPVSAL